MKILILALLTIILIGCATIEPEYTAEQILSEVVISNDDIVVWTTIEDMKRRCYPIVYRNCMIQIRIQEKQRLKKIGTLPRSWPTDEQICSQYSRQHC